MKRRRFLAASAMGIGLAAIFDPFNPVVNGQTTGSIEGLERDIIYLTAEDGGHSSALWYRPTGKKPKTAVILMHPRVDFTRWYLSGYLTKAGYGMLGCASRYVNNDANCLTENVLLDIAAGIKYIKEHYGIEKVITYGHSGGGSLYAFYQGQAQTQPPGRLSSAPSGDPPDLNKFTLPTVDGMIVSDAHKGEGKIMGLWIDPAVVDESDPYATNPVLDMYDEKNGYKKPPELSKYSADFITRYRTAQIERVRRIDTKAKAMIEKHHKAQEQMKAPEFAKLGAAEQRKIRRQAIAQQWMVIYRTGADLKYTDLSIDPSDRLANQNAEQANYGGGGIGRIMTPQGWLSTWSSLSSRMIRDDNLAKISIPTMVIGGTCDTAVAGMQYLKDAYDTSIAKDKTIVWVKGGDHNFNPVEPIAGGRKTVDEAGNAVVKWLQPRFPAV